VLAGRRRCRRCVFTARQGSTNQVGCTRRFGARCGMVDNWGGRPAWRLT